MSDIVIPKNYKSQLNLYETQVAIKTVKDFFQGLLAERLHLLRVSAPLFVDPTSGLNDNLNGVERPVNFHIAAQGDREAEIVQSLAKWKRYALQKYGFKPGEGLYTDMSAIRQDETTDNIHSIYVDQWDWEKIITKDERNLETLKENVRTVYKVLRKTEKYMSIHYDYIEEILHHDIFFVIDIAEAHKIFNSIYKTHKNFLHILASNRIISVSEYSSSHTNHIGPFLYGNLIISAHTHR